MIRITLTSLAVGLGGAAVAYVLNAPAAVLIGPALAVSGAALSGLRVGIAEPVRNACFVVLGLGVGSGFTTDAGAAIQRWPFAFAAMAAMLAVTMFLTRTILARAFDFDRRSAILAAAPGHLSFVMGLSQDLGADTARIAVVQTLRVLALTVTVPYAALALGYRMDPVVLPQTAPMAMSALAVLAVLGIVLGLLFRRLLLPAPLLLGPMAVSALAHVTGLTEGGVPGWLMLPAFVTMGTLIGTRFTGMTLTQFRGAFLAGLCMTLIAVTMASLAAIPVAAALDMPAPHVMVAFAPGGLETMIALGATMQASPGFVAACHIVRLMILSVLIPVAVGRRRVG